ncbi:ABC transporter permease [Hugenholtzia roseola]|uniref:ABC transporter permease n=1 Tax=Hugenholtzia roseola TaxID=1002 RepID=UPI0004174C9C|nr:FtsX-like permease family protein [Hugenholtzia roseola]
MNRFAFAYRQIRYRKLQVLLSLLLFALSASLIAIVLLLQKQADEQLTLQAKGINLVVGAKGSPLQIVLSTLYHLDNPTGNIKKSELAFIEKHPLVAKTIPLLLGDNYKGFRIVGTNQAYYDHYQLEIKEGAYPKNEMEAIVGAKVASKLNLKIGDTFASTHGIQAEIEEGHLHEDSFKVVGILKESTYTLDHLIFTKIESYWHLHQSHHNLLHDHPEDDKKIEQVTDNKEDSTTNSIASLKQPEGEYTALLVQYKGAAGFMLPRQIQENSALQAAVPAQELQRLLLLTGGASRGLQALAALILVVSALSLLIALLSALRLRTYEMAILRSWGANKFYLFSLICIESLFIALFGTAIGLLSAHGLLFLAPFLYPENKSFALAADMFLVEELYLFGLAAAIALLAAAYPAWKAAQTDLHTTLKKLP